MTPTRPVSSYLARATALSSGMLSVADHWSGNPTSPLWPSPRGPRQLDQSSAGIWDAASAQIRMDNRQRDMRSFRGSSKVESRNLNRRDDEDSALVAPTRRGYSNPTSPRADPPGRRDLPLSCAVHCTLANWTSQPSGGRRWVMNNDQWRKHEGRPKLPADAGGNE